MTRPAEQPPTGPLRTTRAVERAVAVLLGADERTAADAVAALEDAGRIHEGSAVHALVLAARRGTDAATALGELAAGRDPASAWSEFELRIAAEEAADDLATAGRGVGDLIELAGPELPVQAARALQHGARGLVLPAPSGLPSAAQEVELRWIEALAVAIGCEVRRGAQAARSSPDEPTWARSEDYLDVLGLLSHG